MLLLSNDDVASVLTMDECMAVIEDAYREQAAGRAVNQLRYDTRMPLTGRSERGANYEFKTMVGVLPKAGVAALRMSSTINHYPIVDGVERSERLYLAPGAGTVGLVQLYSVETGEPLTFMPDGVLQGMRVGATYGLAAKYLARQDAATMGLLGSGWQARFQVTAAAVARKLGKVKVYSPNAEHRERFAREMSAELEIDVQAVPTTEEAVRDVDILVSATNARERLIRGEFIQKGMYAAAVQSELSSEAINKANLMVIQSSQRYVEYMGGEGQGQYGEAVSSGRRSEHHPNEGLLEDVIAGTSRGRTSDDDVICFRSDSGLGIQFAAAGALVYERAKQRGLGREVPTELFTQALHT